MTQRKTQNFHIIAVTLSHGTSGAHITLHSPRFEEKQRLSYDYDISATNAQAIAYLQSKGFDVIGQAEGKHGNKNCWLIITSTFKSIK